MTYFKQADGEGKLEIENVDGAIVFRLWPEGNADPIEFVAKTQMDLHIVQVAVNCSDYRKPGGKPKRN